MLNEVITEQDILGELHSLPHNKWGEILQFINFLKYQSKSQINQNSETLTAHNLLESELVGLWVDRSDIKDSLSYARQLRQQAEERREKIILVDSDVMIDILRQYKPALDWLKMLDHEEIGIPGLVAMELIQGCRNSVELQKVEKILGSYRLYWSEKADCERALNDYATYHLSNNLKIDLYSV